MLPEVGALSLIVCEANLTGNLSRKMSPISRHVTDQHQPRRAISSEFGRLAFPDEGNGGFALVDDNEEGCLMNPSGAQRALRLPPFSWVTS